MAYTSAQVRNKVIGGLIALLLIAGWGTYTFWYKNSDWYRERFLQKFGQVTSRGQDITV